MTEVSIPSFTVFESLVEFCFRPPADCLLNYPVVCDCYVLAMKAHAAALVKRGSCNASSSTLPANSRMPKVFEGALDFVAALESANKGERLSVADRFATCFSRYVESLSASFLSVSSPPMPAQEGNSGSLYSILATKAMDLSAKLRRESGDDVALKWSKLALDLAQLSGSKELQKKIIANQQS